MEHGFGYSSLPAEFGFLFVFMPLIRFYIPSALEELVAGSRKAAAEDPTNPDNPEFLRSADMLQKKADEIREENKAHPDYPEYLESLKEDESHGY